MEVKLTEMHLYIVVRWSYQQFTFKVTFVERVSFIQRFHCHMLHIVTSRMVW